MPLEGPASSRVPPISTATLRFFRMIVRGYFRRHFRAVLAQHADALRDEASSPFPLIVMGSHASWWDPMVCVLLGDLLLPGRKHYAPMDAKPLARYPILRRIGIFPVEIQTARGAANFLRVSQAVLQSGGVLWVTPQGRFADVRERPLAFKPGVAALAKRVPAAKLLPLSIEYTFWNERLPEVLLRFGNAISGSATSNEMLECALAATMDALRDEALTRDPLRFEKLLEGRPGTGGFYALSKRLRAFFRKGKFEEDHSARDAKVATASNSSDVGAL